MTKITSENKAGEFDRVLGSTIRRERIKRGLSLQELADAIGVSYQQAHKYELGRNRLSVSRLHDISRIMGLSIETLLVDSAAGDSEKNIGSNRLALEMARNFARISPVKQMAISQLVRALADNAQAA